MAPPRRHRAKDNRKATNHSAPAKPFQPNRLNEDILGLENTPFLKQTSPVENEEPLGSSSEDEDIPPTLLNPYNTLLQSLNARSSQEEPHRKKRKLTKTDSRAEPRPDAQDQPVLDNPDPPALDSIDEPLEGDKEPQETLEDSGSESEDEGAESSGI